MPRTTLLPPMVATGLGMVPALVNADQANGMFWPAKPGRALWVKNTNAAACTVTLRAGPGSVVEGSALPDRVITVPANTGERVIYPIGAQFTQADGNVYVDFSVGGATTQVGLIDGIG